MSTGEQIILALVACLLVGVGLATIYFKVLTGTVKLSNKPLPPS